MKELIDAIVAMDEEKAIALTDHMIDDNIDPMKILDAYRDAMAEVGRRFEEGKFFIPELILSGEMLNAASEKIKPLLTAANKSSKKKGKVIIGTVAGDIHDIGKDIVTLMLDINGYEVLDLGIDVPVAKFVEAAKDFNPQVIGMSGFLTMAYDPMKNTVAALVEAGVREEIKIMIGGGQMDNQIRDYVGADAFGKDAIEAVKLCDQWIK
ncbi:MAG: cobalamin-dependent protein [Proteobacteria bacterium]|nr:cobalamin-dependent protein [Pseudomonadota bacterium]